MGHKPDFRGQKVILVALFNLRDRDRVELMAALARRVSSLGAEVVAQVIQRKSVNRGRNRGPGGARRMKNPLQSLSSSTFIGTGKAREVGAVRARTGASLIVTFNRLSRTQQERLSEIAGAPVVSSDALP